MCSYLVGKYYRYGRKINDSAYVIQLFNSPDNYICEGLLARVGCKVHFKSVEQIPAQFIYYFVPSCELKSYFDIISIQKNKLDASHKKYIKKLFKMAEEDYQKMLEKNSAGDSLEIAKLFVNG